MSLRAAVLSIFLVLSVPAIAADVEIELRLPFLLEGGALRPEAPIYPLLPEDFDSGVLVDTGPGPEGDRDMVLWPDVDELLDDLPGTAKIRRGRLTYRGSEESGEQLRQRIEAVRRVLAETVRIRIAIGPEGEEPWLDIDGEVRTGALLVEDARVERSFPANLDLEAKYAAAAFQRCLLGTALAASATPIGRERFLLRLSFVHQRLLSEKRFEGGGVSIVAPETAFATGVLSIPLTPGAPRSLRSHGVSLVVSVERVEAPPGVEGVRAIRTDALRPLFDAVEVPTPGPESLVFTDTSREIPARFFERAGLAAFEVEPDILVIEGDEEILRKLDRELDEWWAREFPAILVTGVGNDLAVAGGMSGYIAAGRSLQASHSVTTASLNGYIREGPSVTRILAGRSTVISFPEPGLLRLHSVSGEVLSAAERGDVNLPRAELRVETAAKATDLPLDGTERDGLSAREEGK